MTLLGLSAAAFAAEASATISYDCTGQTRHGDYVVQLTTSSPRYLRVDRSGVTLVDVSGRDVGWYSTGDTPGSEIDHYTGGSVDTYFASITSHDFRLAEDFDASLRVYDGAEERDDYVGLTCMRAHSERR
jgi:hypothetical protein